MQSRMWLEKLEKSDVFSIKKTVESGNMTKSSGVMERPGS